MNKEKESKELEEKLNRDFDEFLDHYFYAMERVEMTTQSGSVNDEQ